MKFEDLETRVICDASTRVRERLANNKIKNLFKRVAILKEFSRESYKTINNLFYRYFERLVYIEITAREREFIACRFIKMKLIPATKKEIAKLENELLKIMVIKESRKGLVDYE